MAVKDARQQDHDKAVKARAKKKRSHKRRDRRVRYLDSLRGNHHGIQTLAIQLAALAMAAILLTVASVIGFATKGHDDFMKTPLYTRNFTTSASNLSGEVIAFAENKDRTRNFQLYKISAAQGSTALGLPPTAKDYHTYLLGLHNNGDVLKPWDGGEVKATVTQYGSGGYIGVTLESDRPFPQQKSALVIQSQIASTSAKRNSNSRVNQDTPYADLLSNKYDTWVITQNLGADDVATPDWMERLDERKVLYKLIYERQFLDARKKLIAQAQLLKDELETTKADQRAFQSMKAAGIGVVNAELPPDIANDSIDQDHNLHTDVPVEGGWSFDWQHFNGEHGMPKGIIPEGQDLATYVSRQNQLSADSQASASATDMDMLETWKLTNGQSASWLNAQNSGASGATTFGAMSEAMTNLTTDITTYRSDKQAFMTTMMQPFVDGEIEYLAAADSVSQGHWLKVR